MIIKVFLITTIIIKFQIYKKKKKMNKRLKKNYIAFFFLEIFQLMKSVSGDYSLSLNQNLVFGIGGIKPQTSYSTLKGFIS